MEHAHAPRRSRRPNGKLRIATFNCENLFSRPKLLNFDDHRVAKAPLEKLAKLYVLLARRTYGVADKRRILRLLDELSEFVDVNAIRGSLLGTRVVDGRRVVSVRAAGRGDWVGSLALKRDPIPLGAQVSTAEVIKAVDADVQCVVEVEDRLTLERFSETLLTGRHALPYNMVIDGNDARGIDVGILSRYELGAIRSHVFDVDRRSPASRIFSRDCLELEVRLLRGKSLHVLVNHFKSQGYGTKAINDARRKLQADRVVEILAQYNLKKDLVVVAGDFNDRPGSAPLAGLLGVKNLTDVLAKQFPNPEARWTYRDKSQIDYLLVSSPLAEAMTCAGIERRGLFEAERLTKGSARAFAGVTSEAMAASDHAAVWAEFQT